MEGESGPRPSGIAQEFNVWLQCVKTRNFRHVIFAGSEGSYVDPSWFLDLFSSGDGYGSGWSDSQYNEMLALAHATADPALRMSKLAECERVLLQAMPILPLSHDVQPNLRKPFLKGLGSNLLNREQFKYAWIDTNWSPNDGVRTCIPTATVSGRRRRGFFRGLRSCSPAATGSAHLSSPHRAGYSRPRQIPGRIGSMADICALRAAASAASGDGGANRRTSHALQDGARRHAVHLLPARASSAGRDKTP